MVVVNNLQVNGNISTEQAVDCGIRTPKHNTKAEVEAVNSSITAFCI